MLPGCVGLHALRWAHACAASWAVLQHSGPLPLLCWWASGVSHAAWTCSCHALSSNIISAVLHRVSQVPVYGVSSVRIYHGVGRTSLTVDQGDNGSVAHSSKGSSPMGRWSFSIVVVIQSCTLMPGSNIIHHWRVFHGSRLLLPKKCLIKILVPDACGQHCKNHPQLPIYLNVHSRLQNVGVELAKVLLCILEFPGHSSQGPCQPTSSFRMNTGLQVQSKETFADLALKKTVVIAM